MNGYLGYTIEDNKRDVKIIKGLFDCILSGEKYVGHEYIWNIFNAFIDQKNTITINAMSMSPNLYIGQCRNEGLRKLILSDMLEGEDYSEDKYKGKNLLRREILSIFKNVTYLTINCYNHPISLKSLFSLINGTQIKKIDINGQDWVKKVTESSSFTNILSVYQQGNFKPIVDYGHLHPILIFEYNESDQELLVINEQESIKKRSASTSRKSEQSVDTMDSSD